MKNTALCLAWCYNVWFCPTFLSISDIPDVYEGLATNISAPSKAGVFPHCFFKIAPPADVSVTHSGVQTFINALLI